MSRHIFAVLCVYLGVLQYDLYQTAAEDTTPPTKFLLQFVLDNSSNFLWPTKNNTYNRITLSIPNENGITNLTIIANNTGTNGDPQVKKDIGVTVMLNAPGEDNAGPEQSESSADSEMSKGVILNTLVAGVGYENTGDLLQLKMKQKEITNKNATITSVDTAVAGSVPNSNGTTTPAPQ